MKDILLIQTGGTISMKSEQGVHTFDPARWKNILHKEIPELKKLANIEIRNLFNKDSSDVSPDDWIALVQFIQHHYAEFDGFVILHGTDTMAYTASALSFGIQKLSKPVILTGSQVPMASLRSDARRNLINAIEMATLSLNEVAICFNDHVFRGNRTTKMSIGDFDAFASPNHSPLAEIGLNIDLHYSPVHNTRQDPEFLPFFDNSIFTLTIFPGLQPQLLNLDWDNVSAVVLEAFGSGNMPIQGNNSLLPFLEKCASKDVIIAIASQAPYDSVDLEKYESGRKAYELGAMGAGDMTVEAVVTKLMYLLGRYENQDIIKQHFNTSLAGELTE